MPPKPDNQCKFFKAYESGCVHMNVKSAYLRCKMKTGIAMHSLSSTVCYMLGVHQHQAARDDSFHKSLLCRRTQCCTVQDSHNPHQQRQRILSGRLFGGRSWQSAGGHEFDRHLAPSDQAQGVADQRLGRVIQWPAWPSIELTPLQQCQVSGEVTAQVGLAVQPLLSAKGTGAVQALKK